MKRILLYNTLLIASGIAFGIVAYFYLSEVQLLALQDFFGQSLQQTAGHLQRDLAVSQIFWHNLQDLLRIYFLGICLLGLPLLFVVTFAQGFSLGFLCCFLWGQSFLLAAIQFCYIPIYIGAASLAVGFANILFRNQLDNIIIQLCKYTICFLFLVGGVFLFSCLDGIGSVWILQKMM